MSAKFDNLWPKDVPIMKVAYSMPSSKVNKSQAVPGGNVPRIPANNRYAGHDQVVARIAKDLVNQAFEHIDPYQWSPVSQKTLGAYRKFEVRVEPSRVYLLGAAISCEACFVDYGMRSIPDTTAFLYAIEPAMKQYVDEAARVKFANVHRLSTYSVTGGSFTYNGRVYMEFKIEQYLYPDNNLKSW